jgi:elongation factor P
MAVSYNGDICVVLDTQHRTPGNLRAFVQATLRSIRSGKSSDVRFSSTEKVEVIPMVARKMEFSYKDGQDYVFSDPDTFETVTLNPEIVGDAKSYLVENTPVTVTFVEERPFRWSSPPVSFSPLRTPPRESAVTPPTTCKSRPPWRRASASKCRCSSSRGSGSR